MASDTENLLSEAGFSRFAGALSKLTRPALRFYSAKVPEEEIALGCSKLGGRPDLPGRFDWPVWKNKALHFLGQVNLKDIEPFGPAELLPKQGILYFFYDSEEQPWGFAPEHLGSWRVLFLEDCSLPLERRNFPRSLDKDYCLYPCKLDFEEFLTLPPSLSPEIEELGLTEDEEAKYEDFLRSYWGGICHQMLGHPAQLQGDMRFECQFASNGVYCGDGDYLEDPRVEQLAADYDRWVLLLQLDSDGKPGMMWGDCGRLFFWIRREDLAARRFDKNWMVLQCG